MCYTRCSTWNTCIYFLFVLMEQIQQPPGTSKLFKSRTQCTNSDKTADETPVLVGVPIQLVKETSEDWGKRSMMRFDTVQSPRPGYVQFDQRQKFLQTNKKVS